MPRRAFRLDSVKNTTLGKRALRKYYEMISAKVPISEWIVEALKISFGCNSALSPGLSLDNAVEGFGLHSLGYDSSVFGYYEILLKFDRILRNEAGCDRVSFSTEIQNK